MVSLNEIQHAYDILKGKVLSTPLVYSSYFSRQIDGEVYLKLENFQRTGSFKFRGATYKIQAKKDSIGPEGVVAASAGNHAQGVAYAASQAKIAATIIMPEWASITKQEATRSYGGQVLLRGKNIVESIKEATKLADCGMTFIHPFDDPDIIAAQGTIALEILSEFSDPDIILVPVGGGGLIGGIATAAKGMRPSIRVIGVQASACPSSHQSLESGKIIRVKAKRTIADGISVEQPGNHTFPIIQKNVDEIVLIEEERIASAILSLLEHKKILAEGAGAISLAPILEKSMPIPKGSKVVAIISGGNVDTPLLDRILRQGLMKNGRLMNVTVYLDDVPGTLSRLLSLVAKLGVNVLHIYHHRIETNLPISMSRVELELETRGWKHIHEAEEALRKADYRIENKFF